MSYTVPAIHILHLCWGMRVANIRKYRRSTFPMHGWGHFGCTQDVKYHPHHHRNRNVPQAVTRLR